MAQEAVQAVRQAELNAALIERDANQRKEEMLSKAQQNAKILITSITKEAHLTADKRLATAEKQGADMLEAAKQKADEEVLYLKDLVKGKEQEAIKLILSNLI